ncbi:hypothetical protein A3Q56_05088 [Intoshia linei]|uniref:Uncharacterized protein n=1 Tax=Intoshia linei TaxID=1819745 RepID=A0A177B0M2_9BILA|nr:hypothetical protein A3Q56_05088 [Intoshia linei]
MRFYWGNFRDSSHKRRSSLMDSIGERPDIGLSSIYCILLLLALNIDEDAELCQSFNDAESFESDFGDHSTNDQQLSNQMDKFNG